jgi:hypothetical protein
MACPPLARNREERLDSLVVVLVSGESRAAREASRWDSFLGEEAPRSGASSV